MCFFVSSCKLAGVGLQVVSCPRDHALLRFSKSFSKETLYQSGPVMSQSCIRLSLNEAFYKSQNVESRRCFFLKVRMSLLLGLMLRTIPFGCETSRFQNLFPSKLERSCPFNPDLNHESKFVGNHVIYIHNPIDIRKRQLVSVHLHLGHGHGIDEL